MSDTRPGPILTATQAIIAEAAKHGSLIGAQALMFAAAQQTRHLDNDAACKVLIDARRQLERMT